jgi:hypothetical protein
MVNWTWPCKCTISPLTSVTSPPHIAYNERIIYRTIINFVKPVGLIDHLRFYVPLKTFSLIWRCHYCRWRAAKFRAMLGPRGLWAGSDIYGATPAVTRGLGFSGLIRRTAPFSRLLRHTRGRGGPIVTRILMERGEKYFFKELLRADTINSTTCYWNCSCKFIRR